MTTAVIVQARFGSSRLPGKILCELAGRSVLDHVLARCKLIASADVVVCAMPDEDASDAIEAVALGCGVQTFRGSENDVLGRYLRAAKSVDASIILRVTSDCPLIDPDICEAVIMLRKHSGADYASNVENRSFPRGLDCEAFTYAALEMAASNASDLDDREHVTPWLRRTQSIRRENLSSGQSALAAHRWTLDYSEDLAFLRALFETMPVDDNVRMKDVLEFLNRNPEITKINACRR